MSEQPVLWQHDERGVATVTLNRPERNNAYNDAMIQGLLDCVGAAAVDDKVRVIVMPFVPGSADDVANLKAGRMLREAGLKTCVPSEGLVASGGVDLFLSDFLDGKVAEFIDPELEPPGSTSLTGDTGIH